LVLARDYQIHSIAFPAISCGVYGYPVDAAATIAVREVRACLDAYDLPERVVLVAFDREIHKTLSTKLTKRIEAHEDS
jgi:O-acetyl-ADP-ribose deacetylase (regulator of RNase III)